MTHRLRGSSRRAGGLVRIHPQFRQQRFPSRPLASSGLSTVSTPPTTTPRFLKRRTAEVAL